MKRLILFVFVIISYIFAQSEFVGEQFDNGAINYADRTVSATGIGFIPENTINAGQARRAALRIAKADALRQLIELVNGVVLTSETTMQGAMLDDVIKTKVEGAIRGAYQKGEAKYLSDSSVEVTYEVKMSGISEIMIPVVAYVQPVPVEENSISPVDEKPVNTNYTGVIIDARGLGARPALAPRLFHQDGSVVYGPGNYPREYAVVNGVAGYSKSMESAQKDDRVAGNPLIVKGLRVAGRNNTDVVLSAEDSRQVLQANSRFNVLSDCRVLILLD